MPRPYALARRATFLATLLLYGVAGAAAQAQTVRYGILADDVRALLEDAWRDEPGQMERAYCVRRARISARRISAQAVDTIISVLAIRPASARHVDRDSVEFTCPPGTPQLHTQTATACPSDVPRWCVTDGPAVDSCQPSRKDYEKLVARGDPFGIVQCNRRTFRFYYPSDFALASPAPPAAPRPPRGARAAPRPLPRPADRPR